MRLKLLHVVDSLEPGGMENGVVNVASRLDSEVFDVHALCLRKSGEFARRMPVPDQVRSIDKAPGFALHWAHILGREIRQLSPDVIHTHNLGPLIYTCLGALLTGRRYRLIHGEHAELSEDESTKQKLWLRRVLYMHCQRVHAVSETLKGALAGKGLPVCKIEVIPNGVDCDRFWPATDRAAAKRSLELPIAEGNRVVGIVGRFGGFKRHRLLVEAFDLVARSNPELHLLIVGDGGPEKEAVMKRIEGSKFSPRIHWVGFQEEPARWYQAMDLLVMPSINEGLSNAMLEAMACGVPVLSHDSCGAREVITVPGEGGFVADLSDSEVLCRELQRLMDPGAANILAAAGRRGRQIVEERSSMDAMVRAYSALYLAAAKPGRRLGTG